MLLGKTATIPLDATYTPTKLKKSSLNRYSATQKIIGDQIEHLPNLCSKLTVQVNGEDKAITIKDNSYTLLDKDGNEVSLTPAYFSR